MKYVILFFVLFSIVLLSCDNLIDNGDSIEIKQAIPNPVEIGDTLTLLVLNINIPLNVENISQVKVLLKKNDTTYSIQATGYFDRLERQEYGKLFHSSLIDSLMMEYQPVVQCEVDSTFQNKSSISIQLNEKIINSNIILIVNK